MPRHLTALLFIALTAPGLAQSAPRWSGPLASVYEAVRAGRARGETPVVVFDLDDTLFRVAYRTKHILQTWVEREPRARGLRAKVDALEPLAMPYSLGGTLDRLGVTDPKLRKRADAYWGRSFFGNDFLTDDRPVPGAPVYVWALKHAGAHLVYLSGRDEPRMGAGTRVALRGTGFPVPGPGVTLLLKPDWREKDVAYKERVTREIGALGRVVASFDNEPKNVNMFRRKFPAALCVFLDTQHSPDAPPLAAGIVTVRDFKR